MEKLAYLKEDDPIKADVNRFLEYSLGYCTFFYFRPSIHSKT